MTYYDFNTPFSITERETPEIFLFLSSDQKAPFYTKKIVHNNELFYFEFSNPSQTYSDITESEFNKFRNKLKNVMNLNEALTLAESFFSDAQYLFKRIKELSDMFDEEEDSPISIDSLKSMLTFLFLINEFFKPILTLNESGMFHTSWKKDNNNLITLRFKEEESLDYVIFRDSRHGKKPIILNGNMNIFDFKEYLVKLYLYFEISKGKNND